MIERAGVVAQHLAVDMSEPSKITMLYKVRHGFANEDHYGLALARVVDLPPRILSVAEEVSKTLQSQGEAKKSSSRAVVIARKRKLVLGLQETLKQARDGAMNGKALAAWLTKLQTEFVMKMAELDDLTTMSEDESEDDHAMDMENSVFGDSDNDETMLDDQVAVHGGLEGSAGMPLKVSDEGSDEEDYFEDDSHELQTSPSSNGRS